MCGCLLLMLGCLQVIQYAALLGPWPTHVPDSNLGTRHATAAASTPRQHLAPASAQVLLSRARLDGYQHMKAAANSTGSYSTPDNFELYRSILYPPGTLPASAAVNVSAVNLTVTVLGSQHQQPSMHHTLRDDTTAPSGQLLLWYFLGLAAVQPLVLWLQAAALAVVLNVLRHMPEQQLQCLLAHHSPASAGEGAALAPGTMEPGGSLVVGWQREGYQVFRPLSYAWRAQWSWLDWVRFRLLKHSLDAVLVSRCMAAPLLFGIVQPPRLRAQP